MRPFAYSNTPYPIRDDLIEAYRYAWKKLAAPGAWWTGAQRVAIAQETRNALTCKHCHTRKQALSPFAPIEGNHTTSTSLSPKVVDAVHRLTTDPSRLTQSWVDELTTSELSAAQYVEIIGVVVTTLCIDSFHLALGFELEPLPEPQKGEVSRYQPPNLESNTAWVPMIQKLSEKDADLWAAKGHTANVLRALSVVPDEVRMLNRLSTVQYVKPEDVPNHQNNNGRAISRAQIEFVAARVSAINDCFY